MSLPSLRRLTTRGVLQVSQSDARVLEPITWLATGHILCASNLSLQVGSIPHRAGSALPPRVPRALLPRGVSRTELRPYQFCIGLRATDADLRTEVRQPPASGPRLCLWLESVRTYPLVGPIGPG